MTIHSLEKMIVNNYCPDIVVKKSIKRIKKKDNEAFNHYVLSDEVKNHRPWDKDHLNDLHIKYISGARSEDFFMFMAKVSRKVHFKKMLISLISVCAVIAGLAVGVICLIKK